MLKEYLRSYAYRAVSLHFQNMTSHHHAKRVSEKLCLSSSVVYLPIDATKLCDCHTWSDRGAGVLQSMRKKKARIAPSSRPSGLQSSTFSMGHPSTKTISAALEDTKRIGNACGDRVTFHDLRFK